MYEESTQDQYFERDSIHIYAYIHSKKVGCLVLRPSHHDGYYIHTLLGSYASLLIKKYISHLFCLFVCFVALRPKSTAMVMAGRSAHLTTLFLLGKLEHAATNTLCTYFR